MTSGVVDTERNNSSLNDLNVENQKLGQDEIAALKNSGKVRIAQAKGELVCPPPSCIILTHFYPLPRREVR